MMMVRIIVVIAVHRGSVPPANKGSSDGSANAELFRDHADTRAALTVPSLCGRGATAARICLAL